MVSCTTSRQRWLLLQSLIALLGGFATASPALAIKILGDDPTNGTYDETRHSRWYEGVDKDFIGATIGMAGVSRSARGGGGYAWATMISDTYFLSSNHLHNSIDDTIKFHEEDSPTSTTWDGEVVDGFQLGNTDLWIGQLDSAPPSWVHRYPLMKRPETYNYLSNTQIDSTIFVVGLDHAPNEVVGLPTGGAPAEVRVGLNRINDFTYSAGLDNGTVTLSTLFSANAEFEADEAELSNGDSGGPSFTMIPSLGPVLEGIHLGVIPGLGGDTSVDSNISYYVNDIVAAVPETVVVMTDLRGDINGDFQVNTGDLAILTSPANFNSGPGRTYNQGDLNLDGYVNTADLGILASPAVYGTKILPIADFNADQFVNESDFDYFAEDWNKAVTPGTVGDANGDGFVNRDDVLIFDSEWLALYANRQPPLIRIDGDANLDGKVNILDLNLVLVPPGYPVAPYTNGDVNGDGLVDTADLSIVSSHLGDVFSDINDDGTTDIEDVDTLASNWHQSVTLGRIDGDLNEDGYVDSVDLAALGAWWRFDVPVYVQATSLAEIPEPTTLAMAGISLIGLVLRCRNG